MASWQLRIEDPTGETRFIVLPENNAELRLGRAEGSHIRLKDVTLPPTVARLRPQKVSGPYWLSVENAGIGTQADLVARLGDVAMREGQLPAGVPFRLGETRLTVEPLTAPQPIPPFPPGVRPWLTANPAGVDVLKLSRKAAATPLSIYVEGETGTGKEVIATLLHAWSDRAGGPFVPLNCGAVSLSLAESELFGHVKGAFTGASASRPGALLQAHQGTLFLDEIGDLAPDIQVKLLRFLENGEIRPVGADRTLRADVRLVCATHQPLMKLVEAGKFRRDLYYRLASVTIKIPPLRDRPEDIEMLARRFAGELGRTLMPSAIYRLQSHCWPGNVRELRHSVERAVGLEGPFRESLGDESFTFLRASTDFETLLNATEAASQGLLSLEEMEKVMLARALKLGKGSRKEAARILGVARSTLFEMLKRHGINLPRPRPEPIS